MSAASDPSRPDASSGPDTSPELDETLLQQLAIICERCGAPKERSGLMAQQLLKRARQLSRERDWSEAQALEHLLRLMTEGSQGGSGAHAP